MPGYGLSGNTPYPFGLIVRGPGGITQNPTDTEAFAQPDQGPSRLLKAPFGNDAIVFPPTIACTARMRPPTTITAQFPLTKVDSTLFALADPAFPATIAKSGRYFNDTHGKPWLMVGDTAFGLLGALSTLSDIDLYLTTRAAQGFNAIYLNYIFGQYDSGRTDWSDPIGVTPFLQSPYGIPGTVPSNYDIRYLNPTYLAKLDFAVSRAQALGLYLMINPLDASVVDIPENGGWLSGKENTVPGSCAGYGQFLGERYSIFPNVGWQYGNDYGFDGTFGWNIDNELGLFTAAVRAAAPNQFHSIELNYNTSTSYDNLNWGPNQSHKIDWNAVYDYHVVYAHVAKAYLGYGANNSHWVLPSSTPNPSGNLTGYPPTPTYFVEGVYEKPLFFVHGDDDGSARMCRLIAYYTICCGGVGGFYGHGTVFPFTTGTPDWHTDINDPGAICVGKISQVFKAGNWQNLVPDLGTPNLVSSQTGTGYVTDANAVAQSLTSNSWAAGAVTPQGDFGVVYLPVNKTVTVDMTKFRGTVTARWWDPVAATYTSAGSFSNTGTQNFTRSTNNSGGTGNPDWLLVLTA